MGATFVLIVELLGALVGAVVLILAVLLGWIFMCPMPTEDE